MAPLSRGRREAGHRLVLRVDTLEAALAHQRDADAGVVEDRVALAARTLTVGGVARGDHGHRLAVPFEAGRGEQHVALLIAHMRGGAQLAHGAAVAQRLTQLAHLLDVAEDAQFERAAAQHLVFGQPAVLQEAGVGQQDAAVAHARHADGVGAQPHQQVAARQRQSPR